MTVVIQFGIGLTFGFIFGQPMIAIMAAASCGAMYISNIFAISDQSGINILHSVLSINRRDVVLGRYTFGFLVNTLIALISLIFFFLISIIADMAMGLPSLIATQGTVNAWQFSLLATVTVITFVQYSIIAAVQMPVYFKNGYLKANRLSYLPYTTYITILIVSFYASYNGWGMILDAPVLLCTILLSLCIVIYIGSYILSCRFYRKRDL